jgi:hypothetical protein
MKAVLVLLTTILLFSCKQKEDFIRLETIDDTLYLYDNGVLIYKIPQSNTCALDSFLIDYYY